MSNKISCISIKDGSEILLTARQARLMAGFGASEAERNRKKAHYRYYVKGEKPILSTANKAAVQARKLTEQASEIERLKAELEAAKSLPKKEEPAPEKPEPKADKPKKSTPKKA